MRELGWHEPKATYGAEIAILIFPAIVLSGR